MLERVTGSGGLPARNEKLFLSHSLGFSPSRLRVQDTRTRGYAASDTPTRITHVVTARARDLGSSDARKREIVSAVGN